MNSPNETIPRVAHMHLAPINAGDERAQSEFDCPTRHYLRPM
jgi:hypothetical protein